MRYFLILTMFVFVFFTSSGQIQIWLNDGAIINTSNYRIDTAAKNVFYLDKKHKTRYIDHQSVFAIIDKQDTIIVNKPEELTVQQAFSFLQGVNDGYQYKNAGIFLGNMGLGLVSGISLPAMGFSGIYSVIPNLISAVIFGSTNAKDKKTSVQDTFYKKGYQISARKKRLIIATEGGLAGLAAGSIIGYLITKK